MAMQAEVLEADYVIVGAGAVGMAFADEMLTASDADMIIVDRRHQPRGHWNDAYPFVRLHGASSLYGVNSRPLGDGPIDQSGLNAGLEPLPSGAEICAYYDATMRQRLLPSGRVTFLPMCDHFEDGTVVSRVSGRRVTVAARRALVDGTYADTKVPATHPPAYAVDPAATCIAPNALPDIADPPVRITLIGAGKTAMDSALWLLERGMAPDRIRWIRPRDPWIIDRSFRQFGPDGVGATMSCLAAELDCAAEARDFPQLFERLEAVGALVRIDPNLRPSMYRCATLNRAELAELRRISDVVRLGHVTRISADEIVLEHGVLPTRDGHISVNCSAAGLSDRSPRPVFEAGRITLQMVRTCQPAFSGAIIAKIEALLDGDDEKNMVATPVPPPREDKDWARMLVRNAGNQAQWTKNPDLSAWMSQSRLDGISGTFARTEASAAILAAARQRMRDQTGPAVANLQRLLTEADGG